MRHHKELWKQKFNLIFFSSRIGTGWVKGEIKKSFSWILFYWFVTGPAPENITNDIYCESTKIETYELCKDMIIDLDRTGYTNFDINGRKFYLEIIDSVNDYVALMKKIFDFKLLKEYLSSG